MSDHHHEKPAVQLHDLGDGKAAYRRIFLVFVTLAVLTIIEFLVTPLESAVLLFILAFLKAALVVYFFMHVYRLWREDAH